VAQFDEIARFQINVWADFWCRKFTNRQTPPLSGSTVQDARSAQRESKRLYSPHVPKNLTGMTSRR
jgi:hypothetical protein